MTAIANAIILISFMALLVLGTLTTLLRGLRFRMADEPLPRLLIRDIIHKLGLAFPLSAVFIARWAGFQGLSDNLAWVLLTGIPAVAGVGVYAYYEIFVLEGPNVFVRHANQLAVIEQKIDENTKISTDAFHEANTVNEKIAELKRQFDTLIEEVLERGKRRDAIEDARNAIEDAREATKESSSSSTSEESTPEAPGTQ